MKTSESAATVSATTRTATRSRQRSFKNESPSPLFLNSCLDDPRLDEVQESLVPLFERLFFVNSSEDHLIFLRVIL